MDIVLFAVSEPGAWHYIGLKDMVGNNNISDYKWVHDGSSLTYQNWRPGEPDMGSQLCVAMRGTEGKWVDGYCSAPMLSICEADVCT